MNLADEVKLNDSFILNPSASEFVPNTSPHFSPSRLTPGTHTRSLITPLDSVWRNSSRSPSPQSNKKLIKFMKNVHFPKDFLNKCLKVLPHDVSLADVKYQPENFKEKWFDYLKQRESEAAEECKAATGEGSGSFVEDRCFIESESVIHFSSVSESEFVSSMNHEKLDGMEKLKDLNVFCSDFKKDCTVLSNGDHSYIKL